MNKLKIGKVLIEMPFIILTFVLFSVSTASAFQWVKTYHKPDYDYAYSIQQTSDGGYIVAGLSSLGFVQYAWVLKLDGNGNVQWQKTYGDGTAYSIQQTSDGGYIVAGEAYSFGAGGSDACVLKLDGDGNVQWQKTYGGSNLDSASSIQQTSDSGYIVAGQTGSFGAGFYDAWVLKLDGDGYVQWQKTYGGTDSDFVNSIQQTSDSGYIVAGQTGSFSAGSYDVWVLKLDGDGYVQWQKTYGGAANNDSANSIQQTSDNGYIVAGQTQSFGAGGYDAWVLKLDGDGYVQWQKTYGGTSEDEVYSIQQTSDNGYIVAGQTYAFGAVYSDAWVLKFDGNGYVQWQKTYGGTANNDSANSIQQTSDGGYIVAGFTTLQSLYRDTDVWVLRLDANGCINNCSIGGNISDAQVSDTFATVQDTSVTAADSNVSPMTVIVPVSNTNAVAKEQCIYGCSLIPDAATIPRGGTLGFQGTVTNNIDVSGSVLLASKVTKSNGTRTGFIIGPYSHFFEPYQSKSWHKSHTIPLNAPLGTYTYHGYVGNYGAGIYDECWFKFIVTE
jgi:hypothetical protein